MVMVGWNGCGGCRSLEVIGVGIVGLGGNE